MTNEIHFALREFCEVYALKTIIRYCTSLGLEFHWNVLAFPVNTDFNYCSLSTTLSEIPEVSIIERFNEVFLSRIKLFGFATDMHHDLDRYMQEQFSCSEIFLSRIYSHPVVRPDRLAIVVGNIKVKSPVEKFQLEIFQKLASLPYDVIVVPRHPLSSEEMKLIRTPSPIRFINTMGDLENLHSVASITIMGRIFSDKGLKPDDDHNPFEATINSHTLCGIIKDIPESYQWLYKESGLVHQCSTLEEVYEGIDRWIRDPDLLMKLARKEEWIRFNRDRYLMKIVKALQL
ncbi:hypothetical protein BMS3Abin15_01234 [bacterium BMS3Abin15]|nr:hypothetical protein BMS3Abin15_01234 [bacterium BMS3Abin15]